MGSKRLPGKSLFDLAGAPLVGRILERVKRCKEVDEIILAIPDTFENKPLEILGENYKVNVFKGSENDLVDRYYQASKSFKTKNICRLPADNPTPEPNEIDKLIIFHKKYNKNGFSTNLSNAFDSGYPDGIGIEIFGFNLLESINKSTLDQEKREHLHLNFFDYKSGKALNQEWCPVKTINCPIEFRRPDLILDVNTFSEYLFMKELYEYLYPKNKEFSIKEIIFWYDNVYMKEKV